MDKKYMIYALKLAKKAYKKGDVPVGCIIVRNNKIIAKAYNKKEKYNDGEPYDFFTNSKEIHCMHPNTVKQISYLLLYLKENGEEKLHLLQVDPHIPAGAKLY